MRWYASGLLGTDKWLTWLFGNQSAVPQPSFSGFFAPSNYLIVLFEVFAILLFACAVAAEYVGTIFERLNAHIVMARTEAERGQEMWAGLIERLPLPALLIDPDSMRIVASSEYATIYLRAGELPIEGRPLFEALKFSYPDIVQELIVGSDGGAPATVIRVGEQLRVTQIRVLHVAHKGRRLALLTIEDATEVFCLKAALDTSEYAAFVIDARGLVLAFNKPAGGLFGGAEVGADAAVLLAQPDAPPRWWEPGLTGRRKMHIEIGPRIYQVTSSAISLAGEEERIFTVAFLPVARAGTADPFATELDRGHAHAGADAMSCAARYGNVAAVMLVRRVGCRCAPRSVDLSDDRLTFSGNGTTQTNTGGGGGGALGWIHNFDPDTLFGLAAEHREAGMSPAGTFGSLNGAVTRGPGNARYTVYGDAHVGDGIDGDEAIQLPSSRHLVSRGLTSINCR